MRLKLTLAYLGSRYGGWQLQKNVSTIQGEVEKAVSTICQQPIRVHGASRTDAGVHALGQVAHFDPPQDKIAIPWQRALNGLLPKDISVVKVEEVSSDFHSRFSAKNKTYSYSFWLEPEYVLPQRYPFVWECGPLDLPRVEEGISLLQGEHDFASFMNTGTPVKSTIRNLYWLKLEPGPYPQEIILRVKGDGFLKQMVRNIAGLVWLLGKAKVDKDFVRKLLKTPKREMWPPTAPAKGLTLEKIEY
ncbi:MAG: tRNA pseudouridine synthase A [Desulfonauticus sp. 38_4375]|jgi:tRNA pseudouridine38-40 synthase|nr:MAG: tRNA pseudouridine synthase A [Desulfonauticus sp. 38_4375]